MGSVQCAADGSVFTDTQRHAYFYRQWPMCPWDDLLFNIYWQVIVCWVLRCIQNSIPVPSHLMNCPWPEVHGQAAFAPWGFLVIRMSLSRSHRISYSSWLIAGRTLSSWNYVCLEHVFCMFPVSASWLPSSRNRVLNMNSFSFGGWDREMSVMDWLTDKWEKYVPVFCFTTG